MSHSGSIPDVRDRWAAGSVYEEFMGRWSRLLAPRFVAWLRMPAGLHWLDVGCGTGALASAICEHAAPASVVACDPSEAFIEYARRQAADPRASFVAAGAGSLPHRDGGYGCIASSFALNFMPDPAAALREMRGLAAARGTISACVWDYGGRMEFLRRFWDGATVVDPKAWTLDEGERFPLCRQDALTELFRTAGLLDVRCEAIETPTVFASFDDFWRPFLGGTGPAPSYVASLDPDRRAALERELRHRLPQQRDGSIALTAGAWAVRGTVQ